jgi:hypothetical protein
MPATPAHAVSPLSPATTIASAESRGHRHKPILAERFKTKLCRTFSDTGSCPYEERCMFAHGEANLRTKEMNLADKLTTEDAIRNFQQVLRGDISERTTPPSEASCHFNARPAALADRVRSFPIADVFLSNITFAKASLLFFPHSFLAPQNRWY